MKDRTANTLLFFAAICFAFACYLLASLDDFYERKRQESMKQWSDIERAALSDRTIARLRAHQRETGVQP